MHAPEGILGREQCSECSRRDLRSALLAGLVLLPLAPGAEWASAGISQESVTRSAFCWRRGPALPSGSWAPRHIRRDLRECPGQERWHEV